ncbi:MAG: SDR family NAD(P)-dependent oxidoreductase, partial [Chloroflexi bacterium]|nr:SDR family NAD(P)-dependent oxidoreductase [Chloroflexota bacterium]
GATVIVHGRSREKADAVVAEIQAQGKGQARAAIADLCTQADIREMAAQINAHTDRLDVLVNNAGAMYSKRTESPDGIELTWALNHLNYFLLTHLLLDLLTASAPARIVNVASEASRGGKLDFDDLQKRKRYSGFAVYAQSKLANIVFTYELARRLTERGAGVTANVMHPGFVGTGFARNNGGIMDLAMGLMRPFILSPEQGADTLVWLASSPELEGKTGGYYAKRKPLQSIAQAYDPAVQRRLWEVSEQMTGIAVPA